MDKLNIIKQKLVETRSRISTIILIILVRQLPHPWQGLHDQEGEDVEGGQAAHRDRQAVAIHQEADDHRGEAADCPADVHDDTVGGGPDRGWVKAADDRPVTAKHPV